MIARVPIPPENVHRIPADKSDVGDAARAYETDLKRFFKDRSVTGKADRELGGLDSSFPVFDLLLLGVGKDGHVASLFADDRALDEAERWVVGVPSPKGSPSVPRVTLTLPVINKARCVMVLISGARKKSVLSKVLKEAIQADAHLPLARVRPEGEFIWLVDEGNLT
jgi:6-phosphogluconolactonase